MIDFSVIIITFNRSYELGMVLESIRLQNYDPNKIEVIVVDDGSTDDTKIEVEKLKDKMNLNYFYLPHSGVRGKLRNYGAQKSTAERIIFLDGDIVASRNFVQSHDDATRLDSHSLSL